MLCNVLVKEAFSCVGAVVIIILRELLNELFCSFSFYFLAFLSCVKGAPSHSGNTGPSNTAPEGVAQTQDKHRTRWHAGDRLSGGSGLASLWRDGAVQVRVRDVPDEHTQTGAQGMFFLWFLMSFYFLDIFLEARSKDKNETCSP